MTRKIYTLILLLTLALNLCAQERYTNQSLLASGRWVKIRVKDEGVYQLSPATLKSMGFSNPSKVRLYGYNLPMLPEANIENIADDMAEMPVYRKSNGTMLFYSCGVTQWKKTASGKAFTHKNNPYSSYVYYFLTENADAPATFETTDITASGSAQTTYLAHSLHDEDEYSFFNAGRTFFEKYDYATGASKTYIMPFENTSKGDITMNVSFGADGKTASSVTVSSGSNTIGTLSIGSIVSETVASVASRQFTLYDQTLSQMNVTLKHNRSQGIAGHLDYIRLSYPAELSISDKKYVTFSPNSSTTRAFAIAGADNATCVWNVTSPSDTHEMKGSLSNGTYTVGISKASIHDTYVAVNTNATFPTPQNMGAIANQNLHALDGISLVIIVPANGKLTAQAQRLAQAHEQLDGIKCAVVRADEIYNEFSAGTPDATAYRRLMKMLYDRQYSQSPLRGSEAGSLNLLLFGNSMWDNRFVTSGLTKNSQDDYLLVYESDNGWSRTDSYAMEEYLTLLDDGKGVSPLKEKPDCGVGRIPVSNATEAKYVVDKLISYMLNTYGGGWKNTICFMGDDGDSNTHMADAEAVYSNTISLLPEYHYRRIYWDSYKMEQTAVGNRYPGTQSDINKIMQEGALIMNYTGHGSAYMLSHEQVLLTSNFKNWDSPRLPLWFTAACDVAPFDMNTENLACEALINKKGAAMGFIGTARTVYSSANRIINRAFMSHVLANKPNGESFTIGEALAQAKADCINKSASAMTRLDTINKVHYVLLGDPAIKLARPKYGIKIERFNGIDLASGSTPNISAGDVVTIEGCIVNSDGTALTGFDGVISTYAYDSEEHVTCKNNAKEKDLKPFEYDDRTRLIYSGNDSVRSGKFTITFPVTTDINYSDKTGMLYLYAVNEAKTDEAQGRFYNFTVGGSNTEDVDDNEGPVIIAFCDGFTTKDSVTYTTETPTLRINLSDVSGINTTGSGLGHDIVAIIDGKEALTYTLNNYYSSEIGNYKEGSVEYTIPTALAAGKHTLLVRAFDTLNNMGESSYAFEVVEQMQKEYDIIDMSGRVMSHSSDTSALKPGIYIKRTRLTSPTGTIYTKSEKFVVAQ